MAEGDTTEGTKESVGTDYTATIRKENTGASLYFSFRSRAASIALESSDQGQLKTSGSLDLYISEG